MTRRPNFLYIITDQQRADHLGCYGNSVVRTPAIDALASRGVRFERFTVATPICMPNRSTLMTGRMPSLHGSRHNGIPLSLGAVTFVDLLAAAGWQTSIVGKCHLQGISGKPPRLGMPAPDPRFVQPPPHLAESRPPAPGRYDQELPALWRDDPAHDLDLPYYGFQRASLCIGHGDAVEGHYGRWLDREHPGVRALRGRQAELPGNTTALTDAWRTAVPEDCHSTTYVADETCCELGRLAADDRPFFLQCSFPDPHHPFTPPGRYWDMYRPEDVALPASFHAGSGAPRHLAELHAARDESRQSGRNSVVAVSERQAREAIALTYGSISFIDAAIARVLSRLDDLGLSEDTVIVFNSDHGDFMGDHQLLLKGALHYRGLIRVPFIWVDPSAAGPRVTHELAGTIDVARTVLARAGLAPSNGMQGRDLLSSPAPEFMIVEDHQRFGYMGLADGFHVRTLLGTQHRLTLYEDGRTWGELYDLEADPEERDNRYDDPRMAGLRGELTTALAARLMALSDTSPLAIQHGP